MTGGKADTATIDSIFKAFMDQARGAWARAGDGAGGAGRAGRHDTHGTVLP
jgi:hypothetical protein